MRTDFAKYMRQHARCSSVGTTIRRAWLVSSQQHIATPRGQELDIKRIDNIGVGAKDVERLASFYEQALGLDAEVSEWGGTVQVGNATLFIFPTAENASGKQRTTDLEHNPPGLDHIALEVEDIEEASKELESRGVRFPGPIEGAPSQFRYRGFADPEGNMFYIVQQGIEG
jgi:predicted enzyme related to lactoylglutathione lyase